MLLLRAFSPSANYLSQKRLPLNSTKYTRYLNYGVVFATSSTTDGQNKGKHKMQEQAQTQTQTQIGPSSSSLHLHKLKGKYV